MKFLPFHCKSESKLAFFILGFTTTSTLTHSFCTMKQGSQLSLIGRVTLIDWVPLSKMLQYQSRSVFLLLMCLWKLTTRAQACVFIFICKTLFISQQSKNQLKVWHFPKKSTFFKKQYLHTEQYLFLSFSKQQFSKLQKIYQSYSKVAIKVTNDKDMNIKILCFIHTLPNTFFVLNTMK